MTANGYDKEEASRIIEEFGARPEMLVQVLVRFVERFHWISNEAIRHIASELNISRADVHGVVSFYHDFRTEPRGAHVVKICQAESCQAMGGRELTDHARATLGQDMHSTRNDVTLEPVYCLGNCACSPAVMINEKTYGRVSKARFDELVAAMRNVD